MDSPHDDKALPLPGFPIRKSPDQSPFNGSPKLIAVYHVLHRLSLPRHPPYALSSLTIKNRNQINLLAYNKYYLNILSTYAIVKEQEKHRSYMSYRTYEFYLGGGERVRTDDPLRARQVLSQLSYTPKIAQV